MSLPKPSPHSAALVTGASAGIGAAMAQELASRGHAVILVARRKQRLQALAAELTEAHGVRTETVSCDLGRASARGRLPGQIEDLGLDVDILINNAGFATNGPFAESDAEREIEQVRVLVEAPVALTRAFLPGMVSRGQGAILNVASTAAMQPLPYSAGYSAAKAYVKTFSEAIHAEVKGKGVTVSTICPGPVRTDFWEISGWAVAGGETFESAVPKPAWITPQQAAKEGIDGLDAGRRVIVPGLQVRTAMRAAEYVPHAITLPIIERVMRRR
jgi:uncharacterized protein